MSTTINLLPWRDKQDLILKRQFAVLAGISVSIAMLIGISINYSLNTLLTQKLTNNNMLKNEITVLDGKIRQIRALDEEKSAYLEKIEILHSLEAHRVKATKLLDDIARVVPEGLFLEHITREGRRVIIDGKSESNSQVAQFMRNMDASHELENPVLSVISADTSMQDVSKILEFNLHAMQIEIRKEDILESK